MSLDLHRVLVRKQERECARADDFAFKARARSWRLFGDWLNERAGTSVDAVVLARHVAVESDAAIFDRLLAEHDGDRRAWSRAFARCEARAAAELRAELGDPAPYRLA